MKQLLHTPEGVRDIYNVECGKKLSLESRLHKVLQLYGYHDIQTPTFEYFDVFRKEIGTTPSRELYKFFDKEGNTLVLRPDITPSVARAAATLFGDEDLPIRLCYTGNTFVNHSSYQGRMRENTQMGAELIGVDNGNPECMESLRGDRMHAFHGRALAVIRSTGETGEAVVTVRAEGASESTEAVIFA